MVVIDWLQLRRLKVASAARWWPYTQASSIGLHMNGALNNFTACLFLYLPVLVHTASPPLWIYVQLNVPPNNPSPLPQFSHCEFPSARWPSHSCTFQVQASEEPEENIYLHICCILFYSSSSSSSSSSSLMESAWRICMLPRRGLEGRFFLTLITPSTFLVARLCWYLHFWVSLSSSSNQRFFSM